MDKFKLYNKTAIVTGGGSGIGKAISTTFAEAGAHVHILELNDDHISIKLDPDEDSIQLHQCDVSNQQQVEAVINSIAESASIDILINNAAIAHVGDLENTSEDDMDRLYGVNIKGVYNCMKTVIPYFKRNGGGVILNMASVVSSVALSDRFAYSMTKGAVLTMTYSVAKDYLADSIRCNCISPARVHTPFVDGFIAKNYPGNEEEMFTRLAKSQPIGRMGKPEEIANLALYLCSDEASFITGTDYPIDGGFIKLNS